MRRRNERGNGGCVGCLVLIVVALIFGAIATACTGVVSDDDTCYTTGQPGSAQYQRDLGHCIRGD